MILSYLLYTHLIRLVYTYSSEKYEFVSWDDDIPNWMESHKIPWFQTTNQVCAEIPIKLAKD